MLLVGSALVVIGISLTAAYGIGIAGVILNESVILSDVLVDPSNSVNSHSRHNQYRKTSLNSTTC
jgi:hypothetical protein